MMDAIILAGGFGTRLQSVVSDVPKPMAPINGKPFLEILLKSLEKKGIRRVILSVGYKAEVIMNYFGNSYGDIELIYEVEDTPLGTGGAIKAALTKCNTEKVLVINGDTYLELKDIDLELLSQDVETVKLIGIKVDDVSRYGSLLIAGKKITQFNEKGKVGSGIINSGHYLLSKSLLNYQMPSKFSFELDCLMSLSRDGGVDCYVCGSQFIDIGIPEELSRAQTIFSDYFREGSK
ncbi:NTP transferase domain-containing protein [Polynucleobacter paneuropaeus]|nr:NTP transferase domain-containing protein [Polynucleobacter paneuropaeus]